MRIGLLQSVLMALLIAYTAHNIIPPDWDRFSVLVGAVLVGEILELSTGPWRNRRWN